MHAAGPQGPIPASDVVIDGLPRFKLTDESLGRLCVSMVSFHSLTVHREESVQRLSRLQGRFLDRRGSDENTMRVSCTSHSMSGSS
jgi:hypothetical protein